MARQPSFLLLRGHDLPGGGFVAGITMAVAFILQYMARGTVWVEARLRVLPVRWMGIGLLLAVGVGAAAWLFGRPFLSSSFSYVDIPLIGAVPLASALLFDLGVFALVVGATVLMLIAIAHQSVRSHRMPSSRGPVGACDLSKGRGAIVEIILALGIGVLAGSGVWLILRPRTFQVIIGLSLLSYAVNLFIIAMGRLRIGARSGPGGARGGRSCALCRSAAASAGLDRHRHQLCDDRAVPGRPARVARPDGHRPCRRTGAGTVTRFADHLMIAPVVLPLFAGAMMLALGGERRRNVNAALNVVSTFALVAISIALLRAADAAPTGVAGVYRLGDWPAPFAIVLVVDRLAALMLLLTSLLAAAAVVFSLARWHRAGVLFHPLFQFLLMGINGAFLTGDLFNLFVFFEVLLAASYGLALHGSGSARVMAGLHYIVVNLAASLLFLIGVSLIYGVAGTLNMADLAARIPAIRAEDRALLEAGAGILGIAFLVKAGMWPLCFWLPGTYAAAAPPVASIFAILTKVGVYIVLRLWLLLFGDEAGASAQFGGEWLLLGGMATVAFGAIGSLASQDMARLAAFSVLVSSGTVLAAIGMGQVGVTGGALFYLDQFDARAGRILPFDRTRRARP